MKKSMHIRLIAPINWRIDSLMKRSNKSHDETTRYIVDGDKKRKAYDFFVRRNPKLCVSI